MNRLNKFINNWFASSQPYMEAVYPFLRPIGVGNHQVKMDLPNPDSETVLEACPAGVPLDKWNGFLRLLSSRFGQLGAGRLDLDWWTFSGMAHDGIKTYAPTPMEFEALSKVEIRVSWNYYRQPFETTAVLIPEELFPGRISSDIGAPAVAIIRYDHDCRVVAMTVPSIRLNGESSESTRAGELSYIFTWDNPDELIEDHLVAIDELIKQGEIESVCLGSERAVLEIIKRATLNACILLSQYGTRRLGIGKHEEKLRSSLLKTRLPDTARFANERALKLVPMVYGFDQHIKIYDRDSSHVETGTGVELRPHWRRGHWALQSHGKRRADRKLIFRSATLVNAHLLAGPLSATRVTMTTAGRT